MGQQGNGPLIQLATIREYASKFKPKNVIWVFFENDFDDLKRELSSKLLKQYLEDDNFSQELLNKHNEIDNFLFSVNETLIECLENEDVQIRNRKSADKIIGKIRRLFSLYYTRSVVKNILRPIYYDFFKAISEENLEIFSEILAKSNEEVSKWGGKLVFVYIPDYNFKRKYHKDIYHKVVKEVSKLDIPIIDIRAKLFKSNENYKNLFPYGLRGHFNEYGYSKVSDIIFKEIYND